MRLTSCEVVFNKLQKGCGDGWTLVGFRLSLPDIDTVRSKKRKRILIIADHCRGFFSSMYGVFFLKICYCIGQFNI